MNDVIRPIGSGHAQPTLIQVFDPNVKGGRAVAVGPNASVPVKTNIGESVDTFVQDQTTPPLDLFFIQPIGAPTSLAVQGAIDDTSITVASDAVFTVGDYLGLFTPPRFYFGQVLAKPGANVLDLDTPLDFEYTAGSNVLAFTRDLDVNGAVTPQIFEIQGPGGGFEIDITRIMISMTTASTPTLGEFGDLGALTNGIVLRRTDSVTRNIFNAKTNLDLLNLAYDLTFYTAIGQGLDGLGVRYSFSGQDKHGVAVRLGTGESLQMIIQDNLTGLTQFRIMAQGHIVED